MRIGRALVAAAWCGALAPSVLAQPAEEAKAPATRPVRPAETEPPSPPEATTPEPSDVKSNPASAEKPAGAPAGTKGPEPKPEKVKGAENNAAADEITPEMTRAVDRGLAWLVGKQNADGSFGDTRVGRGVAITALAGIAIMADGNVPGRGPYGENVSRALKFVLENCTDNGLIAGEAAAAPMYGHGFATLFLGEVYGMTQGGPDTATAGRLHEALVKAVRLIEQTQNDEGGWRYNPVPNDADVSVTICQVMALRSARNAGLEVAKETIDRAVAYVRECQNNDGGFRYQKIGGPSGWARSAAGVATLQYAGVYEDKAIDRGLRYVQRGKPIGRNGSGGHYFYGHYYAAQATYLAGGEAWGKWWPTVRDELITDQQKDGQWDDNSYGDTYATAMALIVLQMPKRYLPIFQR